MKEKYCSHCRLTKNVSDFPKDKSKSDGLSSKCKLCKKGYNQKHYQDTRHERLLKNIQNKKEIQKYNQLYYKQNKAAIISDHKHRYRQYTTQKKNYDYMKKYGISYDSVQLLKEEQDYKCAICDIPEKELSRNLCVDHCHKKHQVRKMLCSTCNLGLGYFKDNPELLIKAAIYLKSCHS